MLSKDTPEYWAEITRLADLLKWWADTQSAAAKSAVQESMEKLGLVVPVE